MSNSQAMPLPATSGQAKEWLNFPGTNAASPSISLEYEWVAVCCSRTGVAPPIPRPAALLRSWERDTQV